MVCLSGFFYQSRIVEGSARCFSVYVYTNEFIDFALRQQLDITTGLRSFCAREWASNAVPVSACERCGSRDFAILGVVEIIARLRSS